MSRENVHDLFVGFSDDIFFSHSLRLNFTRNHQTKWWRRRKKKRKEKVVTFDTNVYWINECHGISRRAKKKYTKTSKQKTKEWNLIKWNCVTCVLIAFLSFDRDFNEHFLFFPILVAVARYFSQRPVSSPLVRLFFCYLFVIVIATALFDFFFFLFSIMRGYFFFWE